MVNWKRVVWIAMAFVVIYANPAHCQPITLKVTVTNEVRLEAQLAPHEDNYIVAIVWFQYPPDLSGGKEWQIWHEKEVLYTLTESKASLPPGEYIAVATLVRLHNGKLEDFTAERRFVVKTVCLNCRNEWEPTLNERNQDHKLFGVHYDFCGVCQKAMMAEFRRQFNVLQFPRLRLEEKGRE